MCLVIDVHFARMRSPWPLLVRAHQYRCFVMVSSHFSNGLWRGDLANATIFFLMPVNIIHFCAFNASM